MPTPRLDLSNRRFGSLTVVEIAGTNDRKAVLWRCLCDCGCERLAIGAYLNAGQITHCGCRLACKINSKRVRKIKLFVPAELPKIMSVLDFYLRSYRPESVPITEL